MERTHKASLYRRGTATENTAGRETLPWGSPQVAGVPCLFQPTAGKVKRAPEGGKVQIDALVFAHPDDLGGFVPQPGDGLVITLGVATRTTYLVDDVVLEGGGPWDDELRLVHTEESIP